MVDILEAPVDLSGRAATSCGSAAAASSFFFFSAQPFGRLERVHDANHLDAQRHEPG